MGPGHRIPFKRPHSTYSVTYFLNSVKYYVRMVNSSESGSADHPEHGKNFIRKIIQNDLANGTHDTVVTRFPPEPNGYLHIGHAKSIVLNFGLAQAFDGRCHLRFDDTNPETENKTYVESIKEAVRWLGYDWGEHLYFASDYFETFYRYAVTLIKQGDAYVDSLSEEEIRDYRGTVDEPGTPSPYRDRSVEKNLELFEGMKEGAFDEGEHVLRARIDMSSEHMLMRDPLLYRIRHREHYRRGDEWCIYPMYDFAHPLEDAIEDVTHSLCTLEFATNRVLYDWVLEHGLDEEEQPDRPHQYEFSRLNLNYTVMSKSKLRNLIEQGLLDDWDDPRLPTIMGLRRRGVPPSAIRLFCDRLGVTRTQGRVEIGQFEHTIRDDLETKAPRVMGIVHPLKVTITNFPEDETDRLEAPHWPRNVDRSDAREVPFSKHLYIDRDDFRRDPPEGFIRLAPGREVRLRYGYYITCEEVVEDEEGNVVKLRCRYDPETRGGTAPDGRSPDGTLHWVSADHARPVEIRSYDRLFEVPNPENKERSYEAYLNPDSLVVTQGYVEPSLLDERFGERVQFERVGYFWPDPEAGTEEQPVYNQIVPLRDSWSEDGEDRRDMEEKRREKRKEKERQRRRSMAGERDPVNDLDDEQMRQFERFHEALNVDREEAVILARDPDASSFFERVVSRNDRPVVTARLLVNDVRAVFDEISESSLPFSPQQFGTFVALVDDDVISSRAADEVFDEMVETGRDPDEIVEERDLRQVGDRDMLEPIVHEVLDQHPEQVTEYRNGKEGVVDFFIGQVMRETGGAADPSLTRSLLLERLEDHSSSDPVREQD